MWVQGSQATSYSFHLCPPPLPDQGATCRNQVARIHQGDPGVFLPRGSSSCPALSAAAAASSHHRTLHVSGLESVPKCGCGCPSLSAQKTFPGSTSRRVYRRQSKPQRCHPVILFPKEKRANVKAITAALQMVFQPIMLDSQGPSGQLRLRAPRPFSSHCHTSPLLPAAACHRNPAPGCSRPTSGSPRQQRAPTITDNR